MPINFKIQKTRIALFLFGALKPGEGLLKQRKKNKWILFKLQAFDAPTRLTPTPKTFHALFNVFNDKKSFTYHFYLAGIFQLFSFHSHMFNIIHHRCK